MFHHYDVALNSKGGPTADVIIRAFNVADDSIADLFADENGTPIESQSGIPNAAKSNAEGNYDFFIADGFYNLRFYIGDALVQTIRNVQLQNAASVADVEGKAQAAALGVAGSASNLGTFTTAIIPDDSTAKAALEAVAADNITRLSLADAASSDPTKGASLITGTAQGRSRPLNQVITDHGYDVTSDIEKWRTNPGYDGDQTAIQAAYDAYSAICIQPDRVGGLDMRSQVTVTKRDPRWITLGGVQAIPLVRNLAHTGHTFQFGSETQGCASLHIEGMWFVHEGRLDYGAGSVTYPEGSALPGVMLTNDQAHLKIIGGQNARIERCGGWGAVHLYSLHGVNTLHMQDCFAFGGVWDGETPLAQEAISHLRLASGSAWGHNTLVTMDGCSFFGQNRTARRNVSILEKTVQVSRRIGPRFNLLLNSIEDLSATNCFFAQAYEDTIALRPDSASAVLFNLMFSGWFDESNKNALGSAYRDSATYSMPDGLQFYGYSNGQVVSERIWTTYQGPGGIRSMRRFRAFGDARACLGPGYMHLGVEDALHLGGSVAGYNCARSDDAYAAGVVATGNSRFVHLGGGLGFGGGINGLDETDTPDAYGLAANGTKYGIYRPANNGTTITTANITKDVVRAVGGLGMSGGAYVVAADGFDATY